MAAKSKARSQAAKPRTRRSLVGAKIYPASVEPSPRGKRIIEAMELSHKKKAPKGRPLKKVVAGLPKARRAGVETRTEALIAEELSLRKSRGPRRR